MFRKSRDLRTLACIAISVGTVAPVSLKTASLVRATSTLDSSILPALSPGPTPFPHLTSAVSCPTASSCFAVGTYDPNGIGSVSLEHTMVPMAEELSGSKWTAVPLPFLPSGEALSLSAISCASSTYCVAVGQFSPAAGGEAPYVETMSDGSWVAARLPFPNNAASVSLLSVADADGVDCIGIGTCIAVGFYPLHNGHNILAGYRYRPMVETLSGGSWKLLTLPLPRGVSDAVLTAVSCPANGSFIECGLVGDAYVGTGWTPIAFSFLAGRWHAALLPLPPDSGSQLFPWTISCPATGSCFALGDFAVIGTDEAGLVVDSLQDREWTETALPLPAGGYYSFSDNYAPAGQVSCASASSCTAVAAYQSSDGTQTPLREDLVDGSWIPSSLPEPLGDSDAYPRSVSCLTSSSCVAVGDASNSRGSSDNIVEILTGGGSWHASILPGPPNTPYGSITSISCSSPTDCIAVGNFLNDQDQQFPFAETLTNGSWSASLLPLPDNSTTISSGTINAISCPAVQECVAVGNFSDSFTPERPLAEILSDGVWTPQVLPLPAKLHDKADLSAVSCTSTTWCAAIGTPASYDSLLVETMRTGHWTANSIAPLAGESQVSFDGISCPQIMSCVAVGGFWGNNFVFSRPLAASLTGTTWKLRRLPAPEATSRRFSLVLPMLSSVSCIAPRSCVAVGSYPSTGMLFPFVERLAGSRWISKTLPTVGESTWTFIWSISCGSNNVCKAVGEQSGLPLVEEFSDNTWTADTMSLLPQQDGAALLTVSCAERTSCVAAGGTIGTLGAYPLVSHG
jgi:hypothetical protein